MNEKLDNLLIKTNDWLDKHPTPIEKKIAASYEGLHGDEIYEQYLKNEEKIFEIGSKVLLRYVGTVCLVASLVFWAEYSGIAYSKEDKSDEVLDNKFQMVSLLNEDKLLYKNNILDNLEEKSYQRTRVGE